MKRFVPKWAAFVAGAGFVAAAAVSGCSTAGQPAHPPSTAMTLDPPALPETLGGRIAALRPKVGDFFFTPRTDLDRSFYEAGLLHHWQMYQKSERPDSQLFLGYILFGDPYHRGLKRISFLLGTDCSNFVHRLYQMLGAEFRFLKTRHWIHLGKAKTGRERGYYARQNRGETPIDLKRCEWDEISRQFALVKDLTRLEAGDVVVYPKSEGILGTKGHMGIVSGVSPVRILQSKYPVGIVELPLDTSGEAYAFRWTGELKPVRARSMAELLARPYPESIASCASERNP